MKVRMVQWTVGNDKVGAIKALRTLSGFSLKEAKEAIESIAVHPHSPLNTTTRPARPAPLEIETVVEGKEAARLIRDLKGFGVVFHEANSRQIMAKVRDALHDAIDCNNFTIANDLLEVLKKYTPQEID